MTKEMWLSNSRDTVDPYPLLRELQQFSKKFPLNQQHDAHECLIYLIDMFHSTTKNKRFYLARKILTDIYEDEKTLRVWTEKFRNDHSLVSSIFRGTIRSTLIVKKHNKVEKSHQYQHFHCLSVPIKHTSSLHEGIESYMSQTPVEVDKKKGFLQHKIVEFPKCIIFHLMRFETIGDQNIKIDKFYSIPDKIFNHELYAVCSHRGSLDTGHYVSYVKHLSKWYLKDDEKVYKAKLNTKNAYILFYKKIE